MQQQVEDVEMQVSFTPEFIRDKLFERKLENLPLEMQAIVEAIYKLDVNKLNELIKKQPKVVLKKDKFGNRAIHYAAYAGSEDCIQCLINNHAALDAKNNYGLEALHVAAFFGMQGIVDSLTTKGAPQIAAKIKLLDFSLNCSALHLAIINGQIELTKKLLEKIKSEDELHVPGIGNILHLAVLGRDPWLLREMIIHKIVVNNPRLINELNDNNVTKNDKGYTPLSLAVSICNIAAIYTLLSHPLIDFKVVTNPKQRTVLHVGVLDVHEDSRHRDAIKAVLRAIGQTDAAVEFINKFDKTKNRKRADQLATKLKNKANKEELKEEFELMEGLLNNFKLEKLVSLHQAPNHEKALFRNLVFQGGGPKGIAYLGALNQLDQILSQRGGSLAAIERVAGTSAGAITAMVVALNFSSEELDDALSNLDLKTLLDDLDVEALKERLAQAMKITTEGVTASSVLNFAKKLFGSNNQFTAAMHLIRHRAELAEKIKTFEGLCTGNKFVAWLTEIINKKYGDDFAETLTFEKLTELAKLGKAKHLYTVAYRISGGNPQLVVMSSEDETWKHVRVIDAVRASMSIPAVFKPHVIRRPVSGQLIEERYLDGGMLWNMPIKLFDKVRYLKRYMAGDDNYEIFNEETLGFKLIDPPNTTASATSEAVQGIDLLKVIIDAYVNAEVKIAEVEDTYQYRTISISNCGVGLLDFDLGEPGNIKVASLSNDNEIASALKTWEVKSQPDDILFIQLKNNAMLQMHILLNEVKEISVFKLKATDKTKLDAWKRTSQPGDMLYVRKTNNIYFHKKDQNHIDFKHTVIECKSEVIKELEKCITEDISAVNKDILKQFLKDSEIPMFNGRKDQLKLSGVKAVAKFFKEYPDEPLQRTSNTPIASLFEGVQRTVSNQLIVASNEEANIKPRKAIKNQAQLMPLLSGQVPKGMMMGQAYDQGDCFFDALAQLVNRLNKTDINTDKYLRTLCYDFYLKNKELVNKWNANDFGEIDKRKDEYSMVQYTADECDELLHGRTPIWGRPYVEGKILCRQLQLEAICVIEILEDFETKKPVISFHLINNDSYTSISEVEAKQWMSNSKVPTLVVEQNSLHFVPLINSVNNAQKTTMTQFGEYPRLIMQAGGSPTVGLKVKKENITIKGENVENKLKKP